MRQLKNVARAEKSGRVAVRDPHRAHAQVTCSTRIRLSSKSTPWSRRTSDRDLQRAEGAVRIVLRGSEQGTRVKEVFQKSPVRVMFPRDNRLRWKRPFS